MIKAILFDMDGILFDSEKYYMLGTYKWLTDLGFRGQIEELYCLIGLTMDDTHNYLADFLNNQYSIDEIAKINADYFNNNKMDFRNIMFEGVNYYLNKFKEEGYKLACCSSSSKEIILESLREMNIINYFDVILSGEEFEKSKPEPDIYLKACEKLQVEPSDCVVYEDSNKGIMAGINAGIITIARKEERFNLDQSPATYIVDDIKGLENKIKEINIWKK